MFYSTRTTGICAKSENYLSGLDLSKYNILNLIILAEYIFIGGERAKKSTYYNNNK